MSAAQLSIEYRRLTLRSFEIGLAEGDPLVERDILSTPAAAAAIAQRIIGWRAAESVLVVMLDARHRVIGHCETTRGTINANRLQPRDVFTPALLAGAAAVVIAHNHPSGDPQPSRADRVVTSALRSAGELLGVPVLDHVIVTEGEARYSFADVEGWS